MACPTISRPVITDTSAVLAVTVTDHCNGDFYTVHVNVRLSYTSETTRSQIVSSSTKITLLGPLGRERELTRANDGVDRWTVACCDFLSEFLQQHGISAYLANEVASQAIDAFIA